MFSTRDCLYGELVTILDSSDLSDFFFSVRVGSFIIVEKFMWSTAGGLPCVGVEFLGSEDTGVITVVSSVAGNDSLVCACEDDASSWLGL
jgi:hypothetical protein